MTRLNGPFVFVDVDTQRDFLEPGGALYIRGSEEILPNLARLTGLARDRGIPVLATACAHVEGDPEFEVFPPHCLLGTPGQERVGATAWDGSAVLPTDGILADVVSGTPAHVTVHKAQYDVFSHPEMPRVVEHYRGRFPAGEPLFVVYGVASDYCVRCAVEGLLDHGCRVALVADAIRAVDPDAEAAVLSDLARRGALLTVTDVVAASIDSHS